MSVVDWNYQPEKNTYERSQFHQSSLTSSGTQITADTVAVVITDVETVDAVGRRSIRTLGEGEGFVFQDGKMIKAVWKKPSQTQRLKFYDKQTGEELLMNAGQTWIEVIPDQEDVRFE